MISTPSSCARSRARSWSSYEARSFSLAALLLARLRRPRRRPVRGQALRRRPQRQPHAASSPTTASSPATASSTSCREAAAARPRSSRATSSEQAELNLVLPPGPARSSPTRRGCRPGTVAFADTSRPLPARSPADRLTKDVSEDVCGIARGDAWTSSPPSPPMISRRCCASSRSSPSARDEHGVSALLLALYHRRRRRATRCWRPARRSAPLEAAALGDVAAAATAPTERPRRRRLHAAAPRRVLRRGGGRARDPRDRRRPDADAENPFQVRPLHSAVAVGDHASVRALLEARREPERRQQRGYTPLHSAAHIDDAELARCCSSTAPTRTRTTTTARPRPTWPARPTRALLSP